MCHIIVLPNFCAIILKLSANVSIFRKSRFSTIFKPFTQFFSWPGNQSIGSPALRAYVRYSIFLHIIFIVFLPIIIILLLNVGLLMVIRRQSFLMYNRLTIESSSVYQKNGSKREKNAEVPDQVTFRRSIDQVYLSSFQTFSPIVQTSQFNAERRVSVVIFMVVTCFIITQASVGLIR